MKRKFNWNIMLIVVAIIVIIAYYYFLKPEAISVTDESLVRQTTSFMIISAIKSTLSVIEGSTIGGEVSALVLSAESNLQAGDIVQAPYDFIDFIWRILLYSIFAITLFKMLFLTNLTDLGLYMFFLGILLLNMILLFKLKLPALRIFLKKLIILGALLSLILPTIIIVSAKAADLTIYNIEKNISSKLRGLEQEWKDFRNQISVKDLKRSAQFTLDFLNSLYKQSLLILIEYISLIVVKFLFFPIITALIIYYIFNNLGKILLVKSKPISKPDKSVFQTSEN